MRSLIYSTDMTSISITDILDVAELQRMQDTLADTLNVASLITSPTGEHITRPSNFCLLCTMVRQTECGHKRCCSSDLMIAKNGFEDSASKFTPCHSVGLWDTGACIYVGGHHIANWYIGQVRVATQNVEQIYAYAEELGLDKDEFYRAYLEVPLVDEQKFLDNIRMLDFFANELSTKAYYVFKLKNELAEKEALNVKIREKERQYRELLENLNTAVVVHGADGRVVLCNPKFAGLLGVEMNWCYGKIDLDFAENITDENGRALSFDEMPVARVISAGESIKNVIYGVTRKDGRFVWIRLNASPVKSDMGELLEVIVSFDDITEIKLQSDRLRESEQKFRNYIDYAPHGVMLSESGEVAVDVNAAAANIFDCDASLLQRVGVEHFLCKDSTLVYREHFDKATVHGFSSDKLRLIGCSGSDKYVVFDTVMLSEQHFLTFMVEVTDYYRMTDELKQNQEFLIEAQQIANVGNAVIDLTKSEWKSTAILNEILGITDEDTREFGVWMKLIHPDWVQFVVDSFTSEVLLGHQGFDVKFKIIRFNDGVERWVHAIGKMKYDEGNRNSYMILTVQDITKRKDAVDALRKSEALYRTTLNASPDAVAVVDVNGNVIMVSPSFLSVFKLSSDSEVVGGNFFDFLLPNELERAQTNHSLMVEGYMGAIEYEMKRSNNDAFVAEVNGDVIYDRHGKAVGMVFIIRDITEKKNVELALARSRLQLKEFAAHLQSVREEERLALSREIHDDLGQILVAVKMELGLTRQKVIRRLSAEYATDLLLDFDNLLGLVDNTIKTARRIMGDLRPGVLDIMSFQDALRMCVVNFENRYKIQCRFDYPDIALPLKPEYIVALYRIFQESLSNVAQHSQATTIDISLRNSGGVLTLRIEDNGVGFNTDAVNRTKSYGLLGMKERAFLMDGTLTLDSGSGRGTVVTIQIPYKQTS